MYSLIKKRNFQTFCSALPLVGAEGTWKDEERQEGKEKKGSESQCGNDRGGLRTGWLGQ